MVSDGLRWLQAAERESREGMMGTAINHQQLLRQEALTYAQKLALLRKLLPPAAEPPPPALTEEKRKSRDRAEMSRDRAEMSRDRAEMSRDRAEALLERVAARGWTNLGHEEQLLFGSIWSAAQPRLKQAEVRSPLISLDDL
jgi:hypothetical protein